jgi:transketolase
MSQPESAHLQPRVPPSVLPASPAHADAAVRSRMADCLRLLAIDAVQQANSGHPGMPMGMAQAAFVLWTRYMRYSPKNPAWNNRDRFVLSAGHGSMLLY